MEKRSTDSWLIALILIAVAIALYSYNVGQHYFLGDDGFISFRYARQLVLGNGLVWNEGYRVEGYTNFLWVILIAAGMALGFEPEWFAPLLGILSGLAIMLGYMGWLLSRHRALSISFILPVFALSISRSFTAWATGGLETMLFAAFVFFASIIIVKANKEPDKTPVLSAVLFSLATLTRPDGIVFAFAAGCALLFDSLFRKRRLTTVIYWTAIYFLPVLIHVAWRYSYYGYLLPNTFYAKVAGLWLDQAMNYFYLFHRYYNFFWFLPFVFLGVFSRFKYEARYFFFLSTVYLAYITYVGGDRFEFRFLVPAFPFVYWLLAEGIVVFKEKVLDKILPAVASHAVSLVPVIALLATTYYGSIHDVPKPERYGISSIRGIMKYATARSSQGQFMRKLIDEGYYPADLPIALGGAGALPYYTMLPVLDRRGLNNIEIAHMPIDERGRIAHEHDVPYQMLEDKGIAVFDILNRMYHLSLFRLNVKKYSHDGQRVTMRALKSPHGCLIFGTFVSDEKLRELFPRLQLIKPGEYELHERCDKMDDPA